MNAERFVDGQIYEVSAALAPVREKPSPESGLQTEALKGERITVYDMARTAGRGASSPATAMSATCRRARSARPGRSRPTR